MLKCFVMISCWRPVLPTSKKTWFIPTEQYNWLIISTFLGTKQRNPLYLASMLCLNKNPVHFLFNFRFLVLAFGHSFIWVKVELIMIDVRNTNLSDLSWSLEVELKEGTDSDTQLDSAKWIHVVLKDLDFLEEINQKDFEDISRATVR